MRIHVGEVAVFKLVARGFIGINQLEKKMLAFFFNLLITVANSLIDKYTSFIIS